MTQTYSRCSAFKRSNCRLAIPEAAYKHDPVCEETVNGWDIEWAPSGLKWKLCPDGDWNLMDGREYVGLIHPNREYSAVFCQRLRFEFEGTLHACARALVSRVNAERSKDA